MYTSKGLRQNVVDEVGLFWLCVEKGLGSLCWAGTHFVAGDNFGFLTLSPLPLKPFLLEQKLYSV